MTRSATETRRQIQRAQNLARDLGERITELDQRRRELLAELPSAPSETREAHLKEELTEVERELSEARLERGRLVDSAEVLREQLPSPAEVADAEARAEKLASTAREAAGDALDAWTIIAASLADLVPAAGRYAEATRAQRVALQARSTVAEEFGIDPPPLDLPALSTAEVRAGLDLLTQVRQAVAGGDLGPTRDTLLSALLDPLRERLEQAEAAGEEVPGLPLFGNEEAAA